MKYKKQIATGALALSLLVGGSSVFASTPQDLGIKDIQSIYQKHDKNNKKIKIRNKIKNSVVGVVESINGAGFTIDIKNMKTRTMFSADVKTNVSTLYNKNGINANFSDLTIGQKVIVVGELDKTTNIINAKIVKIVDQNMGFHRNKNKIQ
ncbi:MAG: hypothetical protein WC735_00415 [Candidatus Paceibacterota bacterium]|jgi:hypothetical protein